MGINLTYDEKMFLGSMADKDMTLEELIRALEASSFEGKDALLVKIRNAMKKMKGALVA